MNGVAVYNPEQLASVDPVEEAGWAALAKADIPRSGNAGRIFAWLWQQLRGGLGTIEITRQQLVQAAGVTSESGGRYGLQQLLAAGLVIQHATGRRQGPLVLGVRRAAHDDRQRVLPGFEREPGPAAPPLRVVSAAVETPQLNCSAAQRNCAVELRSLSAEFSDAAAAASKENSGSSQRAVQSSKSEEVAATVAAPPPASLGRSGSEPARDVRRVRARPDPENYFSNSPESSSCNPDPESFPDPERQRVSSDGPSRAGPARLGDVAAGLVERYAASHGEAEIAKLAQHVLTAIDDRELNPVIVSHVCRFAIRVVTPANDGPAFDHTDVRRIVSMAKRHGQVPRKYFIGTCRKEFAKREWEWPFKRGETEPKP